MLCVDLSSSPVGLTGCYCTTSSGVMFMLCVDLSSSAVALTGCYCTSSGVLFMLCVDPVFSPKLTGKGVKIVQNCPERT